METVEVAVIGAGVTGAAAAWRLALDRREVLLVEQFESGHARGSSHGATRIFRLAYEDPGYVRMAQLALPLWRELEESTGTDLLRVTGGLDAGTEVSLRAIAAALDANGAAWDLLEANERARRFPEFELGDEYGLFSPDSGVIAAGEAVQALYRAASGEGTTTRFGTRVEVRAVEEDAVRLSVGDEELRARVCVLAAGGWTGPMLAAAGMELPLRVTCEQTFYFASYRDLPVFIHRDGISYYLVPQFGGAPGVKVGEHATGREATAGDRPFDIEPRGAVRVRDWVRRTVRTVQPEPVGAETCLYTNTPDEDFLILRRGALVLVSACSGHGFKFGPLLGEIAKALVTGSPAPVDLRRFGSSRFAGQ